MLARIAALAGHPAALWLTASAVTAWALVRINPFRAGVPLGVWGDASIVFEKSLQVLQSGHYPASLALGNLNEVFPYPPPAALMFGAVASLGPASFMALWVAMIVAALFAVFRFSLVNEPIEIQRAFVALMPAVIVLCHNPIVYDLLNVNNNLIVLALVMASFALMPRAPIIAGVLLALPIAIKLYSAALLLWALVYRPRAALACAVALGVLWLLVPFAVAGLAGSINLYHGWFDQLAIVSDPWVYALPRGSGPPLVSLRRAAAYFTGSPPYSSASATALFAMQTAWVAVLIAYAIIARQIGSVGATSRAALADWAVLLLVPLPFSPWLEPYHAVGMIPALILLVLVLFDEAAPRPARVVAGWVCGLFLAMKLASTPFDVRGAVFLTQFTLLVLGLGAIRCVLAEQKSIFAQPAQAAVAGGSASTE